MTWTDGGVIGGAITPLTDDDTIDWESLHKHLHHLAQSGLAAVLVNASMAEGGHLTSQERAEILTFAIREVSNQIPVIATVYGANTAQAAAEARQAAEKGAQGLLVFPHPAFGGEPLDPGIPVAYFRALWDSAGLPMIVFRTPPALAPTFGLDVLQHLRETPGVAAIKDSTGDLGFYTDTAKEFLAPDSPVKVLVDYDPLILDFLRAGAHGATVISSVTDPERYVRLFENRGTPLADEIHHQLVPFARAVYEPPFRDFRARLKEALRRDGVIATAHVRPPLPAISDDERERIASALAASRATAS